jgi:hypothetical protein
MNLTSFFRIPNLAGNMEEFLVFENFFAGKVDDPKLTGATILSDRNRVISQTIGSLPSRGDQNDFR